jgi:hypothetical protein
MSKLRKALIVIWAVAMAASLYGWLRYSGMIPTRPAQPPFPFVGMEAGTKDKDFTVVTVRVRPITPPHPQPIWHQEAETITIDKLGAAGKAEWERDAAARRGH